MNIISGISGIGVALLTGGAVKLMTSSSKLAILAGVSSGIGAAVGAGILLDASEQKIFNKPAGNDTEADNDSDLLQFATDVSSPSFNYETLRDFCGSFYDLAKTGNKYGMLHVLPEAIRKRVEEISRNLDRTEEATNDSVHEVMESVVSFWLENDTTRPAITRWMETQEISQVSKLDVYFLVDAAYNMVLGIEYADIAWEMIPCKTLGPELTPKESELFYDGSARN